MSMSDPIADMLTRIRNSSASHRDEVNVPYSKVKFTIAKILEKCGFVGAVEACGPQRGHAATCRRPVRERPDAWAKPRVCG